MDKYENMTVEEFCKKMNCTTKYFEHLCSDIKKVFSCSDDECISFTKSTFFGNDMQDIDTEMANRILRETMEKYESNQ